MDSLISTVVVGIIIGLPIYILVKMFDRIIPGYKQRKADRLRNETEKRYENVLGNASRLVNEAKTIEYKDIYFKSLYKNKQEYAKEVEKNLNFIKQFRENFERLLVRYKNHPGKYLEVSQDWHDLFEHDFNVSDAYKLLIDIPEGDSQRRDLMWQEIPKKFERLLKD